MNKFKKEKLSDKRELSNEELKDYYEQHPSRLQFYTNLGLVIITLFALFFSFYFSKKNLELSTTQYLQSIKQFNYLRASDSLRALSDKKKDKDARVRYSNDSSRLAENEGFQKIRNQKQDKLNGQQLEINRQQLAAIKTQASTAQSQFDQQKEEYSQQLYERRPILTIDSVRVDSGNKISIKKISFVFSNRGIRPAHVDSTVLAFYNPNRFCFSVTSNKSNLDALNGQNALFTSWINIFDDCYKDDFTIYYLLIYYHDKISGQSQIEPIFFKYGYVGQHQFYYKNIYGVVRNEFIERLKKKNILVIE